MQLLSWILRFIIIQLLLVDPSTCKSRNISVLHFGHNYIYYYGFRVSENDMSLLDSLWSNNSALNGGAIYVESNNDNYVANSVFSSNVAYGGEFVYGTDIRLYGGGAIYLGNYNLYNEIVNSTFENNKASFGMGGAISSHTSNHGLSVTSTTFVNNFALEGGGLSIFSHHGYVLLSSCHFTGNEATDGGAIASILYNVLYMHNTIISHNMASGNGGGMFFYTSNYKIQVAGSVIASNNATYGAGCYFGPDHKTVVFAMSTISSNNVTLDGGGVYCDVSVAIFFEDCVASYNTAGNNGGALYQSDDTAEMRNSTVSFNSASNGGGLYVADAFYFDLDSNSFYGNNAVNKGGAMYVLNTEQCYLFNSMFHDNFGGTGASLWVSGSYSIIANNRFDNNTARSVSGGVYWEHSMMSEPLGLRMNNSFSGNRVMNGYGPNMSTEPYALRLVDASNSHILEYISQVHYKQSADNSMPVIVVDSYDSSLELHIEVTDYYGSVVVTDNSSFVTVEVSQGDTCGSMEGYLRGSTTVRVVEGVAMFTEFRGYCTPGMNMVVRFVAEVGDSVDVTSFDVLLQFRTCLVGEKFVKETGECITCPLGTYSLRNNSELSVTSCNACPSNAVKCYGNVIDGNEGFWRINSDADKLLSCPYTDACLGGNVTGEL